MSDTGGLEKITSFQELVNFLRDELNWPIEAGGSDSETFDDITYPWPPKELGLKPEQTAHIREIHQLMPLYTGQPWGIFFISFEDKKLPVSVLKRILGGLVVKKRKGKADPDQPGWQMNDLLFISNFGPSGTRQLSFLHFSEDGGASGKPILKELGWDQDDPKVKQQYVYHRLKKHLSFPENPTDVKNWREIWAGAFITRHGEEISTTKELTKALAALGTKIRHAANEVLDHEGSNGPLTGIYENFKSALFHHLTPDDFADMYAQTICYGLLVARISRESGALVADDVALMAQVTHPFLKELMETFLAVGGRKAKIDFNELGVDEVVELLRGANMEAILLDFDNRNPNEDPILHFYEHFLKEYDSIKRAKRGVYYTPRPVVSFIVRSVDEILQKEFGLKDGLADITTWGEMVKKNPDIKIPEGVSEDEHFVQILDPATGTGTFLVEVIKLIEERLKVRWRKEGNDEKEILKLWDSYVRDHLLPRLYGFELLMAAYSIAHVKIGKVLYESGFRPRTNDRLQVYLTNTLEEPTDPTSQFQFMTEALAEEARGANRIKSETPITVIIGNPPYSGESMNKGKWIRNFIENYMFVDGVHLGEKGKKNWLQDDYVKFISFAEHTLNSSSTGILAYITNHGFLDNPTFRGMRYSLLKSFSLINVLDLHGNSKKKEKAPDGGKDENVFDIQQGVSIGIFRRPLPNITKKVLHSHLWGLRGEATNAISHCKYSWLLRQSCYSIKWTEVKPCNPFYFFIPENIELRSEYESYIKLNDIMPHYGAGIITSRDHFIIDFEDSPLKQRLKQFRDETVSNEEIRDIFKIRDNSMWSMDKARQTFRRKPIQDELFVDLLYRPYDKRRIYFETNVVFNMRLQIMRHLIGGDNLALVTTRQTKEPWSLLVANSIVAHKATALYDVSSIFPLYLKEEDSLSSVEIRANFSTAFLERLEGKGGKGNRLETVPSTEKVFHYIYGVLHSPAYRERYADFLKLDFPRIPLPGGNGVFDDLVVLGRELVALHLLDEKEAPILKKPTLRLAGSGEARVEKTYPKYENGKVFINPNRWFEDVRADIWEFHIGGYQVCSKWLKDRAAKGGKNPSQGRVLTADDIQHYCKVVTALGETIRLMEDIDKVINKHGGWPGAFYVPPPPPPSIEEIVKADEGQEIEYKASFQYSLATGKKDGEVRKAVLKEVAAFLNSGGGMLVMGVTDDKEIIGLENDFGLLKKDDKKEWFRQTVVNYINQTIGEVFAKSYEFRFASAQDGKEVFIIEVKERGPKPAFLKVGQDDEFFIRTDNKTIQLTGSKQFDFISAHWK